MTARPGFTREGCAALQQKEAQSPLQRRCPDCGCAHFGPFDTCARCSERNNDEQRRLYY